METRNDEVICLFQDKVSELLLRHRSILDSISKHAESAVRVNRAITKSVTGCGCISVNARKQQIPAEISFEDCRKYMVTHIEGALCENCKETIEEEIGNHLFYLTALCHLLDFKLDDVLHKEYERINALGYFHLL
jgi:NTP pyrophosphatase (non-canonical NTP hydrolase)